MNNAVSAAVGFIPLAGDVILAAFKANSRNAGLLEEFLRIRGEEFIKLGASSGVAEAAATPVKDGKDKGKGKTKEVAKGVTKSDAEQVKPGAGVDKGEKVIAGTAPGQVPGGLSDVTAVEPASGSGSKLSPSGSGKSIGRKGFGSFFAKKAPAAGEKGRFVENVDNKTKN